MTRSVLKTRGGKSIPRFATHNYYSTGEISSFLVQFHERVFSFSCHLQCSTTGPIRRDHPEDGEHISKIFQLNKTMEPT